MRNRLRIFPLGSEGGGGSAAQTQLDLLLAGATLYPSFAQDDYRPVWPFDTPALFVQGRIHELTELHPASSSNSSPSSTRPAAPPAWAEAYLFGTRP